MRLVDTFPTNKIKGLEYRIGRIMPFGATVTDGGVNFSIYSTEARGCTLLLFNHGANKPFVEIPFPEEFRIGDVYTMMVFGLNIETVEYGYRFDGEYAPEKGLRFDKSKVLLDPYAKSISGRSVWGKERGKDDFQHRGQIIREDYDWEGDKPLELLQQDLIIYEMHVRSFTAHQSSGVKYKGTYAGILEKIPYLKELGINCIELMPIFEFDEFENSRVVNGQRLLNYWGYSTVGFFAPKAGYAASAPFGMESDELKNMIKHLHRNGIEVILDVVFNHTAEGNENGPYISFKGIDNRNYYLLTPDGGYYNFSGCGNTMNCNNPVVRNFILDCLRYWVFSYHVDGFRFDLASILSRDEDGHPMMNPPLLESLAHDAVLGKSVLIAEAWDAGGLYQVGSFPSYNRWAEWNGKYRDAIRQFVKGTGELAPEAYRRIRGSEDLYGGKSPLLSVNFITCHDGFTLNDLVSYNDKHNEGNGEDNRDGSNDNYSWNCGAEGECDDPEVNECRLKQMKNFMTILLTSRGMPMFLSGDEFANSQKGNNNAYCQDNEISYLDWNDIDRNRELFEYVKNLIAFRKAHPVLTSASYDFGPNGTGYPELSFHGTTPWELDENASNLSFAYLYAEDHTKFGTKKDTFIYVLVNSYWEKRIFHLPIIPNNMNWHIKFDTNSSDFNFKKIKKYSNKETIELQPRSTIILVAI
ncbi:glycogen debranching protein GlgX [Butyrivibrio sp. DSM 10294]|uniref:glycogen debranching protein GlgX n=1 Tax=Butyrivibrio sp. DSM 10294 TaxID=2972457 RepID=UPI00234F5F9A|nr:glycogen debranching protein GlgX [Butyrivibrio sp. DSM 10294]MDC7295352.1 glycogen debranching protein GlgX [Butyrivibrio sp. DSM 10294]